MGKYMKIDVACLKVVDYTPSLVYSIGSERKISRLIHKLSSLYCTNTIINISCLYTGGKCLKGAYPSIHRTINEEFPGTVGPTRLIESLSSFFLNELIKHKNNVEMFKEINKKCTIIIITDTLHDKCGDAKIQELMMQGESIKKICEKIHIVIYKVKYRPTPKISTIGQSCINFTHCLGSLLTAWTEHLYLENYLCGENKEAESISRKNLEITIIKE